MMYLDANFFILALLDDTEKGEKAAKLQEEIIKGKKAITSALVLDEVMWYLIKQKKQHLLRKTITDIYATPNLEVKGVPPLIPITALHYMEECQLKPRDAFHVAIMEECNVQIIVSDDRDFDKVKTIKRIGF